MLFAAPIPFAEAVNHLASKRLLPTTLDSAALRQVDASIRRQSIFSAKTTLLDYLADVKGVVESILNPKQEVREGAAQPVTVGFNPTIAREQLRNTLGQLGYSPDPDTAGTIQDLSSSGRINLVVNTNVRLAQGAGHYIQANASADAVDLWPAWEFIRTIDKEEPRQWTGPNGLWVNACRRAGDTRALAAYGTSDRMCALKSSAVWSEISNSDYTPGGLDQPFDPVAFNTGMEREELSRDEAEELGLIAPDQIAKAAPLDLTSLFAA